MQWQRGGPAARYLDGSRSFNRAGIRQHSLPDGMDEDGMLWFEVVGLRKQMEETQTLRKTHHGWI